MGSASEMRQKSETELQDRLLELRREQFNLRVQQATGGEAKADQVARVRRDIARLKTVLRERELAARAAGAKA
ncbi:MAG: 50S ribosomal protein L29 [Gammaproteobacteria bacterium]|nr:50S ribosomal protein L29 [Gammaproteobacteria bacterium]